MTACICVYRADHKPVYFALASAWETNCYSKTPNRQLSVVSGHKNLCDLWESGNKTIKCWRWHWNVSLSHFISEAIYKLSFYKQKHFLPWYQGRNRDRMAHFLPKCPTIIDSLWRVWINHHAIRLQNQMRILTSTGVVLKWMEAVQL